MVDYDFNSAQGQQNFQNWVMRTIQNEINSYARQVLGIANTGVGNSSNTSSSSVSSAGDKIVPTGIIFPYAGGNGVTSGSTFLDLPEGWLYCYGQPISRTAYSNLFRVIGTQYGVGDGSSTFNLPDLRNRAPFGRDVDMTSFGGSGLTNRITNSGTDNSNINGTVLGASGGDQRMHSHNHTQNSHNHGGSTGNVNSYNSTYGPAYLHSTGNRAALGSGWGVWAEVDGYRHTHSINSDTATNNSSGTGGSQNMPPVIIVNYIIKT